MTVLSRNTILKLIETSELVTNYASIKDQLQPASFDFRLGDSMKIALGSDSTFHRCLDPHDRHSIQEGMTEFALTKDHDGNSFWVLEPNNFALGYTMERVCIPSNIGCQVSGRSSIGRLGLFVHITAGWVDPGFCGYVTLEIYNANPRPIILYPGMKIGQFIFQNLDEDCEEPYHGRYQDQAASPEISRFTH